MLKRLELVGFKSFADKTQFDFGPGLTAIVGPNGSGKSNVVDAVRWILGEQSAKSLRGDEMADVIFNGSTSRRSLGIAEVTLTLDNSRRALTVDADEVQVTRRVYRDGQGEYLINKQPARLKDIKEMFLGSGAATDAYSIIEQGRVDVLLQASTRERRLIFEEAAGISRFKAKKVETLRKLERVEQNLLRLHDIREEVDRQLRSVKLQAAKAQRYQEHAERLKELRVALSLDEFHQLTLMLQQTTAILEELRAKTAGFAAEADQLDAQTQRLEAALNELDAAVRRHEAALAAVQQTIVAEEAALQHERSLSAELEQDLARTRTQLVQADRQLAGMAEGVERGAREHEAVERACAEQREAAERLEAVGVETARRLNEVRTQVQGDKVALMEQMRHSARLHNEQVSLRAQTESLAQHRQRLQQKTVLATQSLSQVDVEVHELGQAEQAVQDKIDRARLVQNEVRQQRDKTRQLAEETGQQLGALRERRSGLASRIQVLEGLEQSREGLGAGVREALDLLAQEGNQPEGIGWGSVVGLVADLIAVRHEDAALVDAALGERAQHLLVRDPAVLAEALAARDRPFSGRVSFLPLARSPDGAGDPSYEHPELLGRASQLVRCERPDLIDLPEQLLGSTLIVKDLATARELSARLPNRRFVSLQGELLETNGVVTVGDARAASGILSRKSELRELREQAVILDQQIGDLDRLHAELREILNTLDRRDDEVQQEMQVLGEQAADLRSRLSQQKQRHEGLAEELQLSQAEMRQIDEELGTLREACRQADEDAGRADEQVRQIQARLDQADGGIAALERERHEAERAGTSAQVALAKAEERRAAVAARQQRAVQDYQRVQAEQAGRREHVAGVASRLQESRLAMLRAGATLAQAFVDKEAASRAIALSLAEQEQARQIRHERLDALQQLRQEREALQQQLHARELEANDLRHRGEGLRIRLREDHELDLTELYQSYQPPETPLDHAAQEAEVADLRRKISRLGSVSLDALQELQELETRAQTLRTQHDDLTSAKHSLDEIIQKINQDSRRLFGETFTAIREHFQELFRKLFGGGMADILLEDENDILESGIEIIARPPGKELRSISLLSGGEKTLTAVALLLAVFRNKPSPFCILDEVDAALDEANIGRYVAVLREFLDRSQFILITHSKKTMAAADVLYGVTMQESGVSKRVAIRFEDWPEGSAEQPGEGPLDVPEAENAA